MDKCSCGYMVFAKFIIDSEKYIFGTTLSANKTWICNETQNIVSQSCYFCPRCGDQLLPDGRVIQRESVPNKLMTMLKEVQATCPESGLQEFALKVFNDIERIVSSNGGNLNELKFVWAITAKELLDNPAKMRLATLFEIYNFASKGDYE